MNDLIENYQKQIEKLKGFGLKYIDYLNQNSKLMKLSEITKFEKGFEVGSTNYISKDSGNYVRYLRVGDLTSQSNPTFISKENATNIAYESDALIALDGAPGRTAFGLKGAFSSGIYKINSDFINKDLVYFKLISKMNQKQSMFIVKERPFYTHQKVFLFYNALIVIKIFSMIFLREWFI